MKLQTRVATGVAALAVAGVVAGVILARGGPSRILHPGPSRSPSPARQPFVFPAPRVIPVPVERSKRTRAAREAATAIQDTLSAFYSRGFVDSEVWSGTVPDSTWEAFAPAARARARADAESLTVRAVGAPLEDLEVTSASLTVRVLLDPKGHPVAADADALFKATAKLRSGQSIELANQASYIFQRASNRWVITGYPRARTEVSAPGPLPGPSSSPSASAAGVPRVPTGGTLA
jgi:hypothetical protein